MKEISVSTGETYLFSNYADRNISKVEIYKPQVKLKQIFQSIGF